MQNGLNGIVTYKTGTVASAGAGNTDVTVRPAAGEMWEILALYFWQDDGDVATYLLWTDPDNSAVTVRNITTATGQPWFLLTAEDGSTQPNHMLAPITLTYDRYFTYRFVASAGAKNGTWRALVRIWKGIPVEA